MARRERHVGDVGGIPRRDDEPAGVGVHADLLDDLRDLVDRLARRRRPRPPLHAVDGAELARGIRPLVPDGDAVLAQPPDVRRALQEPEQLVGDRLEVHALGGDEREALREVEPQLAAEHAAGAGARAIGLVRAVLEHVAQEVFVGRGDRLGHRVDANPDRRRAGRMPRRAAPRHPPSHGPRGRGAAVASRHGLAAGAHRGGRAARRRGGDRPRLAGAHRPGAGGARRVGHHGPRTRRRRARHGRDARAVLDRLLQPLPVDRAAARRDLRRLRRRPARRGRPHPTAPTSPTASTSCRRRRRSSSTPAAPRRRASAACPARTTCATASTSSPGAPMPRPEPAGIDPRGPRFTAAITAFLLLVIGGARLRRRRTSPHGCSSPS